VSGPWRGPGGAVIEPSIDVGELQRAVESRAKDSVELLRRLTEMDAPTGDPEALEPVSRTLAAELERLGAPPVRHRGAAGTHLEGRLGPAGAPPVLLLCHYDTVWPAGTARRRPFRIDGGIAHGPGVYDMRGGLVAALGALDALIAIGGLTRPVTVLLTADEESGGNESRELLVDRGRGAGLALVPEPSLPGGAMKTRRKGWGTYELRVSGRAAHAGLEPERGVSAIDELVDRLTAVRRLANPALGTTVSCGVIDGGSAANVIPETARALIDVRARLGREQERVDAELRSLTAGLEGAEVTVDRLQWRPPMERTPAIASAAERARKLAAALGLALGEGEAGGSSDGNHLAPLGVPVLDGLGPEGAGAHAEDERVDLASLLERTALIALLIADL
jgi:glutamate carboxypeptidase